MPHEDTQFIKLERLLCLFRYALVVITLFTLEKPIYLNEPLLSKIGTLCVIFAIWSSIIYKICKNLGDTPRKQYLLGLVEWGVDLVFINSFAYVFGSYSNGFIYLIAVVMLFVVFARYGIGLTTFILDFLIIVDTYMIYHFIYKHTYILKEQNMLIAIVSMVFILCLCLHLSKVLSRIKKRLESTQKEIKQLKHHYEENKNLYRVVTHIYQSNSVHTLITRFLESIYDVIKEPNIGVLLYGEDGIENNAKMYNYYDKEKGRRIYAQRAIETIREHPAYKNCILNHEPIQLENMPDSLEFIREMLLGKEEKFIYLFNLMKNNKVSGLVFISVQKTLDPAHCKYIEEIIYHTGLTMFRAEALEKERSKVIHDQLTGAKTRHYMEEILPHYVSLVHRKKMQVGIMFIDIDHFKYFNDCYGHATGDLVLKKVVDVMQQTLPKDSLIVRYGGEEFLIILAQTSSEKMVKLGQQLKGAIHTCSLQEITKNDHRITVSIGIAMYPTDGSTIERVIKCADEAMYLVKQTTRNNVCLYETIKEEVK